MSSTDDIITCHIKELRISKDFLYHAETRRLITYRGEEEIPHAKKLPLESSFHKVYIKKPTIKIPRKDFEETYQTCITAQESRENAKNLTKKLFDTILEKDK